MGANVALWGIFWNHFARKAGAAASTLPWSVLFNSSHPLQLITSDPDIDEIQGYTGQQISVSDYANHNYIPYPEKLTPQINQICHILLHGNKASLVDAPIAVNIAELAQASSKKVEVHAARSVQLSNLQTDDNFVLLGSPRSNPWAAFLSDQLNFRFVYANRFPTGNHTQSPSASTRAGTICSHSSRMGHRPVLRLRRSRLTMTRTDTYCFLGVPMLKAQKLRGNFVTELPRLTAVLKGCGISPTGPLRHFELLLRLNMMAGSPTNTNNVEACRILSGNSIHSHYRAR
jgi:hypothetical protein